jgi:nitrite reductase (cytochrome c-552)
MTELSPSNSSSRSAPAWLGWVVLLVVAAATFALGLLAASVVTRREEARLAPPLRPIDRMEVDNARWGENFPREYASYKQMLDDSTRTRYGGAFPRDYLAETPANVILFAGYGFAKEYKQARGHMHAVEDVTGTKRVNAKTPGTCFTCKSPDVPRLIEKLGAAKFYSTPFADLKGEVKHPIGCLDCHEPNTMRLRVTRPALREAFARQGRDIDQVSHQEMRTLVCAQCHVEYYFKEPGKYLTFPWDKGTRVEEIEAYYDESDFSDWTNAVSQTPMLKMQHPDYEVYSTGIHAFRNVACADCHMPYRTEGGAKFTDHHVQSPLLNLSNSCVVCHRWSEQDLRTRVEAIQDKVHEGRARAEEMVARAHFDIAAAMQAGAKPEELKESRRMVRRAQMRWDYVAANNGMGFHSPQECMRVLESAVELAAQCRLECARVLARHGVTTAVRYPDLSSKEKAQSLVQTFADGKPPALVEKK